MEDGDRSTFYKEMVIPIASAITIVLTVPFSQTIYMSPTTSTIIVLAAVGLLCEFFYAVVLPTLVRLLSAVPRIRKCVIGIVIAILTFWTFLMTM